MILRSILAAAALAATAPAFADEVRMSAPIEAGSLTGGGVALVAYYVPLADDAFEVTATWLGADDAEPSRLVMRLEDGDAVSFSLPGHLDTRLTFARAFETVTLRAEPAAAVAPRALRNASL